MRDKIDVNLGDRSYTIHIGTDLLKSSGEFIYPILNRKKIAIVTDENVASLHLSKLKKCLMEMNIEVSVLILPAGCLLYTSDAADE